MSNIQYNESNNMKSENAILYSEVIPQGQLYKNISIHKFSTLIFKVLMYVLLFML